MEFNGNKKMTKSPASHIQRVFGSDIEFTEKQLVSNMDPEMIKESLMEIFKLDTLTKENMKHILREGAHTNNVLRITDECFERMVDTLNLPLDPEPEDLEEHQETLRDDEMEENKLEELEKSSEEDKENQSRVHEENTVTVTSAFELSHLSNKLILGNLLFFNI